MPVEIVMPAMEMTQDAATLVAWLKGPGDWVEKGEPVMEIETDKMTVPVEAPASGFLARVSAVAGDEVPVGVVVAVLLADGETESELVADDAAPARVAALPKARRRAEELGMDLASVTAADGAAIRPEDVDRAHAAAAAADGAPRYRSVPLAGMRRRIADRVSTSYRDAPHVAFTRDLDLGPAEALVAERRAFGAHVTLTAVVLKAVAAALRERPALNAHLVGEEIRLFEQVDLGVAVALEDGLVVPVLRAVDAKDLDEVSAELAALTERARSNGLVLGETSNGTFTVSNLGMHGVEHFTAILNPPQVGILAVGAVRSAVVPEGDEIVVRRRMRVTLVVDHRVIDGDVAAGFLTDLTEALERMCAR